MYQEYKNFIDKLEEICSSLGVFSAVKVGVNEQVDRLPQATITPDGWSVNSYTLTSIVEEYAASIFVHARPDASHDYSWKALYLLDLVLRKIEEDATLGGIVDVLVETAIRPAPERELSVARLEIKAKKVVTYG